MSQAADEASPAHALFPHDAWQFPPAVHMQSTRAWKSGIDAAQSPDPLKFPPNTTEHLKQAPPPVLTALDATTEVPPVVDEATELVPPLDELATLFPLDELATVDEPVVAVLLPPLDEEATVELTVDTPEVAVDTPEVAVEVPTVASPPTPVATVSVPPVPAGPPPPVEACSEVAAVVEVAGAPPLPPSPVALVVLLALVTWLALVAPPPELVAPSLPEERPNSSPAPHAISESSAAQDPMACANRMTLS